MTTTKPIFIDNCLVPMGGWITQAHINSFERILDRSFRFGVSRLATKLGRALFRSPELVCQWDEPAGRKVIEHYAISFVWFMDLEFDSVLKPNLRGIGPQHKQFLKIYQNWLHQVHHYPTPKPRYYISGRPYRG